ncbi:MAG TPA: L-lactate permease [Enteractinococcus helveticum]|uniref:L-lactate permease n=1 Tax=Enteractinococcus helveticum TaxID=1837282 RepID=A0A921K6R2_9MICC|nr:L-lactate permease [Enteractinococcus helveticum]HJF13865.1 L-lactate permease [Enteractinococcus helveticum]
MTLVLAAVPVLVVIGLLLTRLPAWVPPVVGVLAAIVVGLWVLDAQTTELTEAVGGSMITMLQVLAIIGGGVTLARVMDFTGAQKQFADWLSAGGASLGSALMMANGVVPFMESVTGFGVSLLIGLPLTLAFGFTAYRAALITLMGIVIGPWGSMGPGTLLGAELAGQPLTEFGLATAVVNFPAVIISGVVTAFIAARHAGVRGTKRAGYLAVGAASGLSLALLVLVSNLLLGTPVAGAVAAAIMTIAWLLVVRKGKLLPGPGGSIVPYAVLVFGTIAGQLISSPFESAWWTEIVASPAVYAFAGVGVALLQYKQPATGLADSAFKLWLNTGVPTALYILFGVVMQGGHIAETLAQSLAGMGSSYLFLMPIVGALGGYMTASGTGTNAMFGPTQVAVGTQLNVDPQWSMAMNNASGCWGTIASPARIELAYQLARGASMADDGPQVTRARLLAVTIPVLAFSALVWGVLAYFFLPGLPAL